MGEIYRRITVAMWADDKFRRLSRPTPNAQSLWVYLLAGPETSQIPGLIVAGEAGMAESLRWPIDAFRHCWREIADQGMVRADWENRVVWVPNAVRHNVPANPNVIRSWKEAWDLVPDCTLKANAWVGLRTFISGVGKEDSEPWVAAFDQACRKPSAKPSKKALGKPSAKGLPKQEQEQQQDKDMSPIDPACSEMAAFLKAAILQNTADARVTDSLAKWANVFRLMRDCDGRDFAQVKAVIEWATADDFWRPNILSAGKLREKYDTLNGQMARRGNRASHPTQATSGGFVC